MKTLVRVTSPPFLVSVNQPTLSSTLLELVRKRFEESSQDPLPHPPISCVEAGTGETSESSEQAVMILTLIDSLPYLSESALEEWLPIVAETLNFILDEATRSTCQQRFWEVLSNGEMDVDRAALCVWWWSTMGGKEMVFPVSKTKDNEVMSSGLGTLSKL